MYSALVFLPFLALQKFDNFVSISSLLLLILGLIVFSRMTTTIPTVSHARYNMTLPPEHLTVEFMPWPGYLG